MIPKHQELTPPLCVMFSSLLSRRFAKRRQKKSQQPQQLNNGRGAASLANLA